MTEALFCEHKYRRDVETCPHCDLNETEAQLAAARAELKRLQESDPHRIAMVLQEALDEKREEWQERSRDGALALEEVCRQLDAARAEVERYAQENAMLKPALDGALKQRDATRAEVDRLNATLAEKEAQIAVSWEAWTERLMRAEQQRDAARAEVERLQGIIDRARNRVSEEEMGKQRAMGYYSAVEQLSIQAEIAESELATTRAQLSDRERLLRGCEQLLNEMVYLVPMGRDWVAHARHLLQQIEAALSGTQEEGGCP